MSIRSRLILVLLVAAVGSGVVLTYIIYRVAGQAITHARLQQLESIASIQASRVLSLLDGLRNNISLIASRTTMRRRLEEYHATGSVASRADMVTILKDARGSNPSLREISILGTNGVVVASTEASRHGEVFTGRGDFTTSGVVLVDVSRDTAGRPLLLFTAPLKLGESLLGFLAVIVDTAGLAVLAEDHTGLGASGEVILLRRAGAHRVQYLAPLRFDSTALLRDLELPEDSPLPTARALYRHEEAIMADVEDYRGHQVMAVTRHIAPYDWGMVVKMDRREVLAPVVGLRNLVMALFGAFSLGMLGLAMAVASSISAPIVALTHAAERIRQGDLTYDVEVRSEGELHTLATSFRDMARQLIEGRRHLEERVRERTGRLEEEIGIREGMTRKLREANQFLEAVVENIPDMVFVKDARDLRFVRFNKAGEDLLGYAREQLIGRNDYDFFPKDEAEFFTRKDRGVLEGGGVLDIPEEPIQTKSKGVRYLHTKKIPIRDDEGRPLYLLGISEDVTAHKLAKEEAARRMREVEALNREMAALLQNLQASNERLEKTAAALREANEELESFSYSVSHDLRTPLRAIHGYAQVMVEDHGALLDGEARKCLGRIQDGATKMGHLIDDLLLYARVGRQEFRSVTVAMEDLVRSVLQDLAVEMDGRAITLTVHPLPPSSGDPVLLRQAWLNLLANAIKFTRPVAAPVIEVGARVEDEEVVYYVKDNGVGFDMKYIDKVFSIFQRLHAATEFEGTGVGLAIVHRIVKRHGGRVWAEARVGSGATFYMALPREGGAA